MNGRIAFWINSAIFVLVVFTYSSPLAAVFQVSNASQLHTAFLNSQSNGQHDTIRIAQGNYIGNFIYSTHNAENLTIEGGWKANFSSRVINANNTILDGNQSNNVFVFSCDKPINLTIDGITFQNGRQSNDGVGIYISNIGYNGTPQAQNSITIKNNNIKNNYAVADSNSSMGIGLYIWTYAYITINNNTITGNQSSDTNSGIGGGMYLDTRNKIDIINNQILNNKASRGSGGHITTYSHPVRIIGNTISNNVALDTYGDGGGLYVDNWVFDTPSIISRNNFSNNKSGRYGGGLFWRAGGGDLAITNNLFIGNMAAVSGGAATIWASRHHLGTFDIINNTLVSNQAGSHGGGVDFQASFDGTIANLYNNIFWQNSSNNPGYDMYLDNDFDDNYLASVCNLHNNNFNQSGFGIYMDIPFAIHSSNLNYKDPLFAGAWNENYQLSSRSPSLNTGNNNAPSLPPTDLNGKPRIQGGIVDMGAYEGASELIATQPVLSHLMLLLK